MQFGISSIITMHHYLCSTTHPLINKIHQTKAMTDENATQEVAEFQELTQAGESKPTLNKFEKIKAEKDGLVLKQELDYLASISWEAMDCRCLC